jgi:uncharacterized protein (TIGR02246 family)
VPDDRESQVRALYERLLEGWNQASADAFAAAFAEDGEVVGFDGSQIAGRAAIAAEMGRIFADHPTGRYVGKVRGIRSLAPDAAILRAVAGVVPDGRSDIEPALNSVQALVAQRGSDGWKVVLYQNTPAQFHGRPDLTTALTDELRTVLRQQW